MNSRHEFDTIIVGGGPGGSTAGAFLAQAGQKVLILEKLKFPRFRIGESLLPFGNDVLKASGAWPKVEAAGFIPKLGAEFFVGNDTKQLRLWFRRNLSAGHDRTFQVERSKFDQVLLDHAVACGCEVREACAKDVEFDDDGVFVVSHVSGVGNGTDVPDYKLRARWLVDASGRETFLAKALQLPRTSLPLPKRVAVYAHYRGVYRNCGEAAGHISIVRLKDGWFWFIPLDDEKTSVGMVRTMENGRDVSTWFDETVAGSSDLRKRMAGATRVGDLMTTSDYTYWYESLATPRALMVGDAGGFVDPIFSSGVFLALKSAQRATELILRAGDRALTAAERRGYTKEVHRMMMVYFKLIVAFYDNEAFEVFMNPVNRFDMIRTITGILAGNTENSFAIWWRMQFFYAVCRLQRRFAIVPRLNFADS
jgi:flavin-dependent dehydrogenase